MGLTLVSGSAAPSTIPSSRAGLSKGPARPATNAMNFSLLVSETANSMTKNAISRVTMSP